MAAREKNKKKKETGTTMEIKTVTGEECKKLRPLWEEVFFEDSELFTDYYFEKKAAFNTGYVIGKYPYDAMLFRTPYSLMIGKQQREISYLVGVATRKECRHKGYMKQLLLHSFKEMYDKKQPFTFLMPANPAIYEPFGFRYIYEREVWKLKEGKEKRDLSDLKAAGSGKEISGSKLKAAAMEADYKNNPKLHGIYAVSQLREKYPKLPVMEMLAEFSNKLLQERYRIYVHRDAAYYERQLLESRAQNGDIYVQLEQGGVTAFYLYAKEGEEVFLQEVLEKQPGVLRNVEKSGEKQPVIMARILHLEEMLKLITSPDKITLTLRVEDELLKENNGVYEWKITPEGSQVLKLGNASNAEISLHISELTAWILKKVFLNEIV